MWKGIGQKVALQEALIFIVKIVENFKIESSTLDKVIQSNDPTLRPVGLEVKMIPRK